MEASADDCPTFQTRTFEYDGSVCVVLPPWSDLKAGDEVVLFKIGDELRLLPAGAAESEQAPLRRQATLVARTRIISVPDDVIPQG